MGSPLHLAGPHRQQRLGPIEGLDLTLLVHTEYERAVGRRQIQPDDVADFLDEQRILRQLEGLGTMRLQGEGPPDAVDRDVIGRLAQLAVAATDGLQIDQAEWSRLRAERRRLWDNCGPCFSEHLEAEVLRRFE